MIRAVNKLSVEKRVQILSMLVEGSSMRSMSRVADVSINTVAKLLIEAGTACAGFHDRTVRNVAARKVKMRRDLELLLRQAAQRQDGHGAP
jgi:hypothetical protein